MAVWHETETQKLSWKFPPPVRSEGKVIAVFFGDDVRKAPFQGIFYRYQGVGKMRWYISDEEAEDWIVIEPRVPMLASSMEEAKALFTPFLPDLEAGIFDAELFDARPYEAPIRSLFVEKLTHQTHQAKACIAQWPEGIFRMDYAVFAPNGKYFPVSTPSISSDLDHDWGVAHYGRITLADTLEEARIAAHRELQEIVTADPDILERLPEP